MRKPKPSDEQIPLNPHGVRSRDPCAQRMPDGSIWAPKRGACSNPFLAEKYAYTYDMKLGRDVSIDGGGDVSTHYDAKSSPSGEAHVR